MLPRSRIAWTSIMRWLALALPLAAGFADAAGPAEPDVDYLRGSAGSTRTYVVLHAPARRAPLRNPAPDYTIEPPAPERIIVSAPPPVPVAVFAGSGWTGYYAGVTAGIAAGSYDPRTSPSGNDYRDAAQAAAVTAIGSQNLPAHGAAAGIEAGYNW